MTITYKSVSPNMLVKDVEKSIEFYAHVLGFEVIVTYNEPVPNSWVMLRAGLVTLMLGDAKYFAQDFPTRSITVPGTDSFSVWMEVEGVKELYLRVQDQAPVVKELEVTSYGMNEFTIADPDGYLLGFAEEIKS